MGGVRVWEVVSVLIKFESVFLFFVMIMFLEIVFVLSLFNGVVGKYFC